MLASSAVLGCGTPFAIRRRMTTTLKRRVEISEEKVAALSDLPLRVAALETALTEFRSETRNEFAAVRADIADLRGDMHVVNEVTRRDMHALNEDTRSEMRTLNEETRREMRAFDEETRREMHALNEQTRSEIRALNDDVRREMRGLNEETLTQMRVLHEDVISRIALLQERPRRSPRKR